MFIMKRHCFIVIFISIIRILSAASSDILTDGCLRYRIDDDGITIVSASTRNVTSVDIPSHIDGREVVLIADEAFLGCTSLTNITIPDGVTRIGSRAFCNCRLLNHLTIPDSVIYIGMGAFCNCYSLNDLVLPSFLVGIEADTFRNCRTMTTLAIPNGASFIGDNAFSGCKSMRTVTLPDTAVSISPLAFADTSLRAETANIRIDGTLYSLTAMTQVMTNHITVREDSDSGVFIAGRDVTLAPYRIGKYPVTQQLYSKIMTDNAADISASQLADDTDRSPYRPAKDVTFYQAIAFCNKLSLRCGLMPCYTVDGISDWIALRQDSIPTDRDDKWERAECDYSIDGYRLPTEAEAEFAARGGDPADKANWDILSAMFSQSDISQTETAADIMQDASDNIYNNAVDSGTPNSIGIYGISGSVAQLCNDRWSRIARGKISNPIGYDALSERLCFGYPDPAYHHNQPNMRYSVSVSRSSHKVGLRLARSVTQPTLCTVTFVTDAKNVPTKQDAPAESAGDNTSDDKQPNCIYIKYGKTINCPASPNNEGQTFIGWFTDSEGTSLYDFLSPITQDTQIYGRFIDRKAKISAPKMTTVIRKHQTADITADISGETRRLTLHSYQLSAEYVSNSLFASVMGYAPLSTDDSAPVEDISVWQAIAFCNKLSIRAGRTPCYNIDSIDDWIGLPFCDIPAKADKSWDAVTTNTNANGYRLPTEAELLYAAEYYKPAEDQTDGYDNDDARTIVQPTEGQHYSDKYGMMPQYHQTSRNLRLARTIK